MTQAVPAMKQRVPAWLGALILLLSIAAVYGNALDGPFFLDDIESIMENPAIRRLFPLTAALNPPPADMTFCTRPFINLTMCADYARGGLRPRPFRLTNVMFHTTAAVLLFLLLELALRASGQDGPTARMLALICALAWALHPLNSSAVNYLSQRGELGIGLFLFLMLYSLHRSTLPEASERGWSLVAFFSCLLGMGSKEAMAAAPILAAAYDRIFLSASWKDAFQRRGWLYALMAASWIWPISRQLAYSPHVPDRGFVPETYWRYPLAQAWALVHMISLAVWPSPLIIDYGMDMPTRWGPVAFQVALLLLLLLATAWALKRQPRVGFPGLFFFAILAPSSSIIPIVGQPVAEHRMYAPLAALTALAILGLYHGLSWLTRKPARLNQRLFMGTAAVWVVALGLGTHQRNTVYQDAITLWGDTVAQRPSNGRAWNNYGLALSARGRHEEALAACREAARLNPHLAETRSNLANVLCSLGRYEESLEHYQEAIRINPSFGPAFSNYGIALSRLNRHEEALAQHRLALRLNPQFVEGHLNIATTLAQLNRHAEALDHLQTAVRLRPSHHQAHNNLGNCLCELGRKEEAVASYQEALKLKPSFVAAAINLGATLIEIGREDEARALFERFARQAGNPPALLNHLAASLLSRGHRAEGLELTLRLLEQQPGHPVALNNAAWIMAVSTNPALRNGPRALEYAVRAVQILGEKNPAVLATLAAAQAEAGDFGKAVASAEKTLALAREEGDTNRITQYEQRLARFREGRPWRE